ncbi:MAG: FMN-binding negative transcriptional regulator [Rhizomicrobium sp.]
MYRPAAVDERQALDAFIRAQPFATIALTRDGAVQLAYAPVVLDAEGVRFHLAANNPMARADGARLRLSFLGAHAYISPGWYETKTMVPTWNYSAVEGEGVARRLDEPALTALLVDLSAAEEAKLAPKKPWTVDKVPAERMAMLLRAIVGFSLRFETLEGKFKLSQNAKPEDFAGAVRGLEERGDAASVAVAGAMRRLDRTRSE